MMMSGLRNRTAARSTYLVLNIVALILLFTIFWYNETQKGNVSSGQQQFANKDYIFMAVQRKYKSLKDNKFGSVYIKSKATTKLSQAQTITATVQAAMSTQCRVFAVVTGTNWKPESIKELITKADQRLVSLIISDSNLNTTNLNSQIQTNVVEINSKSDFQALYNSRPKPSVFLFTNENGIQGSKQLSGTDWIYLAAIKMSATVIFEFDGTSRINDINFLNCKNMERLFHAAPLTLYSHGKVTMNPYGIFGATSTVVQKKCQAPKFSEVTPRGTPPNDNDNPVVPTLYAAHHINMSVTFHSAGIVQSLISTWPDVNSPHVFSCNNTLEFKSRITKANLHPAQFASINNRATLYHKDTFWSLFTPPSVSPSISDIWRGYIAQTILRCTAKTVVFHKPVISSLQLCQGKCFWEDKNNQKTGQLLSVLSEFKCKAVHGDSKPLTVKICFKQLYDCIQRKGLVTKEDIQHLDVWLRHLVTLKYNFLVYNNGLCPVTKGTAMFDMKKPLHPAEVLQKYNSKKINGKTVADILLIVAVNWRNIDVIPVWLSIYQYLVPPKVIFYCPGTEHCSSLVAENIFCNVSQDFKGYYIYESSAHSMKTFPGYSFYVTFHDDISFHPLIFRKLLETGESSLAKHTHDTRFCVDSESSVVRYGKPWLPWEPGLIKSMTKMHKDKALVPLIKKNFKYCPYEKGPPKLTNSDQDPCFHGVGLIFDSFAVSKKDVPAFLSIASVFRKYEIFMEVGIPSALSCAFGAGQTVNNSFQWTPMGFGSPTWQRLSVQYQNTRVCHKIKEAAVKLSKNGGDAHFAPLEVLHVGHALKLLPFYRRILTGLVMRQCLLEAFQV